MSLRWWSLTTYHWDQSFLSLINWLHHCKTLASLCRSKVGCLNGNYILLQCQFLHLEISNCVTGVKKITDNLALLMAHTHTHGTLQERQITFAVVSIADWGKLKPSVLLSADVEHVNVWVCSKCRKQRWGSQTGSWCSFCYRSFCHVMIVKRKRGWKNQDKTLVSTDVLISTKEKFHRTSVPLLNQWDLTSCDKYICVCVACVKETVQNKDMDIQYSTVAFVLGKWT